MAAVLRRIDADARGMADLRVVQRRRVRPLLIPEFPGRPARAFLVGLIYDEQLGLNVTQDRYAEVVGVSPATLSRFRRGERALSPLLRQKLLLRHPKWKRALDAVALEDVRQADADAGVG